MKNNKAKLICMTGIFSALVFVVTAYLHIPTNNGYVHCGDGFIFIASCVLPMPYSISVGVLGAMFADLLTGYAIWAPGSMIIKGLLALLFTCKANKILTKRNLVMLLPATLISVVGYYLYEVLITESFTASLSGIPSSLIQALASSIVFVVIGAVMDKYDVKKKMLDDYIR
ncbi:MAG: TIGR04002 family protein [Clostridia bacterium]|nr:TIGR04002 family protein [Clostridia bacterium]